MMDGLWVVEFSSSLGLFGGGVMIVIGDRILGGDVGYYYSGRYTQDKQSITGEIDVIRFDQNTISVFGPIDSFKLSMSGTVHDGDFTARASSTSFPDVDMQIKGSKREDL